MKRSTLVLSVLVLAGVIYVSAPASVYADDGGFRQNGLIQRIMERFGLKKADVDEVVNQFKEEKQAEMQQKQEQNLNQAVSEGKITQEQKTALQQKMQEWHNNKPDFSEMSKEERESERDSHRQEMQDWAESQGINLQDLNFGPKGMGRHGMDNDD